MWSLFLDWFRVIWFIGRLQICQTLMSFLFLILGSLSLAKTSGRLALNDQSVKNLLKSSLLKMFSWRVQPDHLGHYSLACWAFRSLGQRLTAEKDRVIHKVNTIFNIIFFNFSWNDVNSFFDISSAFIVTFESYFKFQDQLIKI